MRKIVYLLEQPFDERNYDRFGIITWIDRGWEVEVWDMTPLLHPIVWQMFTEKGKKINQFNGYYVVAEKKQLKQRYSDIPVSKIEYFVDYAGNSYYSLLIKMRLLKAGSKMIKSANAGSIPLAADFIKISIWNKLSHKLQSAYSIGTVKLIKLLVHKFIVKLIQDKIQPSLVVVSGEKSIRSNHAIDKQEIIKAHNFDYDIYLKFVELPVSVESCYGVFVDQDLCFHPDYQYSNVEALVTPTRYYSSLCKGLRRISTALLTQMKIAGHPRACNDENALNYFEGLPVINGSTMELISQAQFVVGHYSTALQIAVLFKKPLIFLTTDELKKSIVGPQIEIMATMLGKQAINLDAELDHLEWEKELVVDVKKYGTYRQEYIKTDGSPELSSWDIVIDHIERTTDIPFVQF